MSVHNKEIAKILNEIADLPDINGENEFRIRSYRTDARTISGLSENITRMADDNKEIQSIPGIGGRCRACNPLPGTVHAPGSHY